MCLYALIQLHSAGNINAYRRTTTGKTREVKCKTQEVKWKFKIHFFKIQADVMHIEAVGVKRKNSGIKSILKREKSDTKSTIGM